MRTEIVGSYHREVSLKAAIEWYSLYRIEVYVLLVLGGVIPFAS